LRLGYAFWFLRALRRLLDCLPLIAISARLSPRDQQQQTEITSPGMRHVSALLSQRPRLGSPLDHSQVESSLGPTLQRFLPTLATSPSRSRLSSMPFISFRRLDCEDLSIRWTRSLEPAIFRAGDEAAPLLVVSPLRGLDFRQLESVSGCSRCASSLALHPLSQVSLSGLLSWASIAISS